MKKSIQLFSLLAAIIFISSCKKDPTPPAIQVGPTGIFAEAMANQIFEFDVYAFSDETELRNVVITFKPNNGITTTLKDTAVSGLNAEFFYHHLVSTADDQALITFTVFNTNGESGTATKRIIVLSDPPLEESTGHILHSRHSVANSNAFNIGTASLYQLAANPDSSLIDLVEYDTSIDDTLSRQLTSWSGLEFVKNNAFNYAEATNETAQSSYASSLPVQIVNDLDVGDILITKYDNVENKYAVIRITAIEDVGNDEQNKYTFSLKK